MTVKELRKQLNKISDNRILNMKVMLQSSNSFYEDDIIDLFLKNNGNNEDVEELYDLLNQYSQCELTDICTKNDLFSLDEPEKLYLIADSNHID